MEYTMKKTRYPTTGRELDGAEHADPAEGTLIGILAGIQGQLCRLDERTLTTAQAVDRMAHRVDSLAQKTESLSQGVVTLSTRVDSMSQRMDSMSQRMDAQDLHINERFAAVDGALAGMEQRFALADRRQVELDTRLTLRLDSVETKLDGLLAWKQRVIGAVLAAGILGGLLSGVLDTVSRLLGVPR